MNGILDNASTWFSVFHHITVQNVLEIVIIAFLIYAFLKWIKNSRSWILLRGVGIIFAFLIFCSFLQLDTILWIGGKVATIAVTALIVIFQPELRSGLERIGSGNAVSRMFSGSISAEKFSEKVVNEIVKASFEMGKARTGALIVVEAGQNLQAFEKTGIPIDGRVSSQLLINIFEHNTPLHDGAVIIKGERVTAATCYLPLSDNMDISKALGTRHRAAIGISEVTDSVTVVVSEETGNVSVARYGSLTKMDSSDELRNELNKLIPKEETASLFRIRKAKTNEETGISDK